MALREDGTGQQGVVAMADPTAVRRKVALCTEEPSIRAPTVRTFQALRMEVAFQLRGADVIVQQVGDREIDHVVILPQLTR